MNEPELSTFEVGVGVVIAIKTAILALVLLATPGATTRIEQAARHPESIIIEQTTPPPAPVTRPRYVKTMYA